MKNKIQQLIESDIPSYSIVSEMCDDNTENLKEGKSEAQQTAIAFEKLVQAFSKVLTDTWISDSEYKELQKMKDVVFKMGSAAEKRILKESKDLLNEAMRGAWVIVSKDLKTIYNGKKGDKLEKGLLLDKYVYSRGLESSAKKDAKAIGAQAMLVPYDYEKGIRKFTGAGVLESDENDTPERLKESKYPGIVVKRPSKLDKQRGEVYAVYDRADKKFIEGNLTRKSAMDIADTVPIYDYGSEAWLVDKGIKW